MCRPNGRHCSRLWPKSRARSPCPRWPASSLQGRLAAAARLATSRRVSMHIMTVARWVLPFADEALEATVRRAMRTTHSPCASRGSCMFVIEHRAGQPRLAGGRMCVLRFRPADGRLDRPREACRQMLGSRTDRGHDFVLDYSRHLHRERRMRPIVPASGVRPSHARSRIHDEPIQAGAEFAAGSCDVQVVLGAIPRGLREPSSRSGESMAPSVATPGAGVASARQANLVRCLREHAAERPGDAAFMSLVD